MPKCQKTWRTFCTRLSSWTLKYPPKTRTGNRHFTDGKTRQRGCTPFSTFPLNSSSLQVSLIPNCKIQGQVGELHVVFESVPKQDKMPESVTRVHIVNLKGFMWKDHEDNVVPTCSCPASINSKDCCAGIMAVLQNRAEFKDWYVSTFFRKELLHRRHRADCDPVSMRTPSHVARHMCTRSTIHLIHGQLLDIEQCRLSVQQKIQAAVKLETSEQLAAPKDPILLTSAQLRQQFEILLAEAGTDQISVSACNRQMCCAL